MSGTGISLTLLGTGVGIPQPKRSQSSLLVGSEEKILIDCGAGTLLRLTEAGAKVSDLEVVFLTHLHLDHVADLLPLANARYLSGDGATEVYGPIGTESWLGASMAAYPYLERMEISVQELYPGQEVRIKGFKLRSAEALHSVTALGYRVERGSRSLVYSGDTEPSRSIADLAEGADLLVHECSFPEPYEVTNHTTPKKLGSVIRNVGRVILTHLYPQAQGHEIEMAQQVASETGISVEVGHDLQRTEA